MKIGRSKKSGKLGWLNRHHITSRRNDKNSQDTVDITVEEHATIHQLTRGLNKDEELGMFYHWFTNRKNRS